MNFYESTLGTLLVGIFFNTFLYGLVTYQFAVYFQTKFNDRPVLKYAVLFLFILDTFHSGSVIYMAWYYVVINYGSPTAIRVGIWPYIFTPVFTALAALVTHLYLATRIWRLTGSKFLYGVTVLLATLTFVLALLTGIEGWIIRVMSKLPRLTPFVTAWLASQVVVDTFITATLVIVFSRSRTGFYRTDAVINRLIRCSIQTGLFASIFALGDLITFVALPRMDFFGMFAIPIGRIYTNTLLDTLLAREILKRRMEDMGNVSVMIDSVYWPPANSLPPISTDQTTDVQAAARRTGNWQSIHSLARDVRGKSPRGEPQLPLPTMP